jgi:nucleoside-triphosphatase THEP1
MIDTLTRLPAGLTGLKFWPETDVGREGDTQVKAKPDLVVLSGESDCGKTTLCAQVAGLAGAAGLDVAGLLSPARRAGGRKVGIDVQDLRSGRRRPLAEARAGSEPDAGPGTEGWRFDPEGLAWGAELLGRATPCDVLVIDELGPLELLRGQGWRIGLDVLRAGGYRLALVVVRPALVGRFRAQVDGRELVTLAVTHLNQAFLAGQLLIWLGEG